MFGFLNSDNEEAWSIIKEPEHSAESPLSEKSAPHTAVIRRWDTEMWRESGAQTAKTP